MDVSSYISIIFVMLLNQYGNCEIRFVCPTPVSPRSDFKKGECNLADFKGDSSTDVYPGLFTVQYEEPVVIKGTVHQIRLYDLSRPTFSCILLDQIPHNDALVVSSDKKQQCKVKELPVGKCGTSSFITVNIPDIRCDQCALQIRSIMVPNSGEKRCSEESCDWLYSCANIRIRPHDTNTKESTYNCQDTYKKEIEPKWSMLSSAFYQVKDNKGLNKWISNENLKFFDDRVQDKISYDIVIPNMQVSVVEIKVRRHSKAAAYMETLNRINKNHFRGELSSKKHVNFRDAYKFEGPLLRIGFIDHSRGDTKQATYITSSQLVRQDLKIYVPRSISYSPHGLLNDSHFVGDAAVYPDVIYPHGVCAAPYFDHYGAPLLNSTQEPSGVITYIANEFIHFSGILPHTEAKWSVSYNNKHIPVGHVVENSLMATSRNEGNAKKLSFTVNEKSVQGMELERQLQGSSKNVLQAETKPSSWQHAIAIISLSGIDAYDITYTIKNFDATTPPPTSVRLEYPDNTVQHNLTGDIIYIPFNNFRYGVWTTKARIIDSGNEIFLHTGHYSIVSERDGDPRYNLTARFDKPSRSFCYGKTHLFCRSRHLTYHGFKSASRGSFPSGLVTMKHSTPKEVQLIAFIENIVSGDRINGSYLYNDGQMRLPVTFETKFASHFPLTLILKATITLGSQYIMQWEEGRLHLEIKLSKGDTLTSKEASYVTPSTTTSAPKPDTKSTVTGDGTSGKTSKQPSTTTSKTTSAVTKDTRPRLTLPKQPNTTSAAMCTLHLRPLLLLIVMLTAKMVNII